MTIYLCSKLRILGPNSARNFSQSSLGLTYNYGLAKWNQSWKSGFGFGPKIVKSFGPNSGL